MNALWDWTVARWPLLLSLTMTLCIWVVAFGIPSPPWWALLYAQWRFDLWWPLLTVLTAVPFGFARLEHRRRGLPQFYPWSSLVAAAAWLALVGKLLLHTGADEGPFWCVLTALALLVMSAFLILSLWAYAELWRLLAHAKVAETLCKVARAGTLPKRLNDQWPGCWGSPHGLRLLYDCHQEARTAMADDISDGLGWTKGLPALVNTGRALLAYLSVRWAAEILSDRSREWLRADVARELITLCLAVRAKEPAACIADWREYLPSQGRSSPCWRFLDLCFDLATKPPPEVMHVPSVLANANQFYHETPVKANLPTGWSRDQHALLRNTWLVLADRGLPPQAMFDLWGPLEREAGGPSAPKRPKGPSAADPPPDLLWRLACKALADFYDNWAKHTPGEWGEGLAGKARALGKVDSGDQDGGPQ